MTTLRVITGSTVRQSVYDDFENYSLDDLAYLMRLEANDISTLVACLAEAPNDEEIKLEISVVLSAMEAMARSARVLLNV